MKLSFFNLYFNKQIEQMFNILSTDQAMTNYEELSKIKTNDFLQTCLSVESEPIRDQICSKTS